MTSCPMAAGNHPRNSPLDHDACYRDATRVLKLRNTLLSLHAFPQVSLQVLPRSSYRCPPGIPKDRTFVLDNTTEPTHG
jgi:hypothetical protein